ncbi:MULTISPECIES: 2'-5' RNA ligase family protein [unclassified Bradyrhizobium]|uniref:2'-5' RNA ligase family protein n=1 Tax=unclassified Bradyrhizobium TaxID=2631580 RepID=UPI002FF234A1
MNPNPFLSDTIRFGSLWAIGIATLGLSAVRRQQHVLPPSGQAAAVHLTLVARLPQQATSGIDEILSDLKRRGPSHHYYPADTVHVTIRNFDSMKGVDRSQLIAQLRHCIGSLRPFSLTARGLGVSPNSVFVQLFPEDCSLSDLRRKLSLSTQDIPRTRKRAGDSNPLRDLLFRRLAFANLIRFSGPVSLLFIREIARHRTTDFGSFGVEELELVQTDRLFSAGGTTTIDRMPLRR